MSRLALLGSASGDGIERRLAGPPVEVAERKLFLEKVDKVGRERRSKESLGCCVGDGDPLCRGCAVFCHDD